jgi:small subunit ribosomal protein S8
MSLSDPISDMLTRIRNANRAKFGSVNIPGSKMKLEIAKVLKSEGYIKNYKFIKDGKQGILRLYLKYGQLRRSAINTIERVSKPSRRVYLKSKDIAPHYQGMGIFILSTSKGIMSDKRAVEENVGGEVICRVF